MFHCSSVEIAFANTDPPRVRRSLGRGSIWGCCSPRIRSGQTSLDELRFLRGCFTISHRIELYVSGMKVYFAQAHAEPDIVMQCAPSIEA